MNAPLPARLLPVERAQAILAESTKVDEVKKVLDQAAAIRLYFRRQRAALESQNHATEIMIWSQRRLGELTSAMEALPPAKRAALGGAAKAKRALPETATKQTALEAEGITRQEASRWKKLADVPVAQLREHIEQTKQRAEKLTVSGTISAVSHGADYNSDEWYTPDDWLELVRQALGGGIDLDPASCAKAQNRVRARRWYGKKDDGLSRKWHGRVFLNPPFSQPLCSEFIAKLIAEHEAGRVKAAIVLLNASTDTRWFHDLAHRYTFLLTAGRIAFLDSRGKPVEGNRVGQVLFCLGDAPERFEAVFAERGLICRASAGTGTPTRMPPKKKGRAAA